MPFPWRASPQSGQEAGNAAHVDETAGRLFPRVFYRLHHPALVVFVG